MRVGRRFGVVLLGEEGWIASILAERARWKARVVAVVEDVAVLRAPVSVAPVVDVVGGFDGISDEIGCSYLVLVVVLGRVRLERLFSESGFEGSRVDASGRDAAV
jgi:hypothetical protein